MDWSSLKHKNKCVLLNVLLATYTDAMPSFTYLFEKGCLLIDEVSTQVFVKRSKLVSLSCSILYTFVYFSWTRNNPEPWQEYDHKTAKVCYFHCKVAIYKFYFIHFYISCGLELTINIITIRVQDSKSRHLRQS